MNSSRLTKIFPSGAWGIDGNIDDAVLKLAAYEDLDYSPEELQEFRWIPVEERLPKLPDGNYCALMVLTAYKGKPESIPMIYERTLVRGRRVERWRYYWDRIADKIPDFWMPLPRFLGGKRM